MYAVMHKLYKTKRKKCFELFGYDFLVDKEFGVKLIEINTNPSLDYDPHEVPFKEKMFPVMIDSAFRIALDNNYPPPPDKVYLGLRSDMDSKLVATDPRMAPYKVLAGGGGGGEEEGGSIEYAENRWELLI